MILRQLFTILLLIAGLTTSAQSDSLLVVDTSLRITNLNAYFTQHVDSVSVYQFTINKPQQNYYWYLRNEPVGLTIGKDNGIITFRAAKNYFAAGKLRYDFPYIVELGVQNLHNPLERIDTFFTIRFYNTEIIPSKLKPTISGTVTIEEGETLSFKILCEKGSFPFEMILFNSSQPLKNFSLVQKCNDEFSWSPGFDFVKETDSASVKIINLSFIGYTKFRTKDTTSVRVIVKNALNYPQVKESYDQLTKQIKTYILQLKYSFIQIDRKVKRTKGTRLAFDLTSASTALSGTILNTSSNASSQKAGKILPSVGLAITPIKEAAAPQKSVEQNQASLIRTSIKRLDYMLQDNTLIGDRDPLINQKTTKLRDELKQVQVQMIDIPVEINGGMTEEELDQYFNSKRVNKKYRLKRG